MPNRLAEETSPYLLQHANNPVDWFPWCDEALEKAEREDKPIFLSIGYSACHWCHVMEHESFEDEQIAAFLNEHFVSIKVDREERPDLDHIYMQAVMALQQQGGWPLSAFLTPDQQIFFGGTYWPPRSSHNMPGFDHVLKMVLDAFKTKREEIRLQSAQLTKILNQQQEPSASETAERFPGTALLDTAAKTLEQMFDFTYGGFGSAPKFPHSMDLQLLMRLAHRQADELQVRPQRMLEVVRLTLEKMYRGGIYDHLAGGFARYSVDERWLVPHFEKMLYDNALLTDAYLDAFLITGDTLYKTVVTETLDYVLAYMTDDSGGFHSTEDADSEGEEGKFYVWTPAEIIAILGEVAGDRFCNAYDVSEIGNFEGSNILNLRRTYEQSAAIMKLDVGQLKTELHESRQKLLKVRDLRIRPGKDDKILTGWNGLMINAMARASQITADDRFLDAARKAAEFVLRELRTEDGKLLRSWRHGQAKLNGYLDDYTYFINALITLYETTFESRWIMSAVELAKTVLEKFTDPQGGGFYFTGDDHEKLIARMKEYQDSSIPGGNSMAALSFARLGRLTGSEQYLETARAVINSCSSLLARSPAAFGQMLIVVDLLNRPARSLVIAAENSSEAVRLMESARQSFAPATTFVYASPDASDSAAVLKEMTHGRNLIDTEPALYVCEGFTCQQPVVGEAAITEYLKHEFPSCG